MSAKQTQDIEEYTLKAVIDIGSTSIRMVVAQVHSDGTHQSLDTLNQSIALGSDTFTKGRISRSTIEECVKTMRNFAAVLKEYAISVDKDVRAVATSAVREARNRDELLDRIYMATDIDVQIIEGAEVNRLTFLGIRKSLEQNAAFCETRLLVAEVGGGDTEFLGLENGRVAFAHSYKLGTYRLREAMDSLSGSDSRRRELLQMETMSGIRQCLEAVGDVNDRHSLLLLGGEARVAAHLLHDEWDEESTIELKVSDLAKLADKVLTKDVDDIAHRYHLPFADAQTLGIALYVYVKMAKAFELKRVHVCGATLRDGLLEEVSSGTAWTDDFVDQILNSARAVGQRYQLDEGHAGCVTKHAITIFKALQKEHRLGERFEVLLQVAAMLHDVGMFIGTSSHHKHSQYLIENSDLFGLDEEDVILTALVARYHRRTMPKNGHPEYAQMTREQRLTVNKLAAILRVADALDRSHTHAVQSIKVLLKGGDQLILEVDRPGDYSAEKRALSSKGKMFEQVYGRSVELRVKRK
jgi:exopolyphosphatase/guanosine-5'-triphosphate,3'-diphosphate pyrophosphatase